MSIQTGPICGQYCLGYKFQTSPWPHLLYSLFFPDRLFVSLFVCLFWQQLLLSGQYCCVDDATHWLHVKYPYWLILYFLKLATLVALCGRSNTLHPNNWKTNEMMPCVYGFAECCCCIDTNNIPSVAKDNTLHKGPMCTNTRLYSFISKIK